MPGRCFTKLANKIASNSAILLNMGKDDEDFRLIFN
jgi:hypothetical protein